MSYILDALKKSEEMRNRNKSNNLFSVQTAPSPQITNRRYIWKWVIVLGLIINGAFMLYWLYGKKPSAHTSTSYTPAPIEPMNVSLKFDHLISVITEDDSQVATNTIKQDKDTSSDEVELESKKVIEKPAPQISDIDESKHVNALEKKEAVSVIHPTESLSIPRNDTSSKNIPQLPAIVIAMHMYSDISVNRLVQINEKVLREGEEIGPHFKLVKITPKGVILNYLGVEYSKSMTTTAP